MAGMSTGPSLAGSQPGKKFNPSTGTWVPDGSNINPNNQMLEAAGNTAAAGAQIAQGTAAGTYHAPMTAAEQDASTRALASMGQEQQQFNTTAGLTAAGQAETQREAQAGENLATAKFAQGKADRASALAALGNIGGGGGSGGGGGFGAGGGAGGGMSLADQADQAAMTTAKEQGGERLAASLKGLHGLMAERGITGSGIEAANTRGLVGGNLQDMATTQRGLIQNRATRAAQVADRNFAAQQAANAQKIQALLSVYGLAY